MKYQKLKSSSLMLMFFFLILLLAAICSFAFAEIITLFGGNSNQHVGGTIEQVYESGTIRNATVYVGDSSVEGGVLLSGSVEKYNNQNDQFKVTLAVEGMESKNSARPMYVAIIMDSSGSMADCISYNGWRCSQTKWELAKQSVTNFSKELLSSNNNTKIALITFAEGSTLKYDFNNPITQKNVNNISYGSANGGTNLHSGLLKANDLFTNANIPENAIKMVLVMSDGQPTYYVNNGRNVSSYGNTTSLVTYNATMAAAKELKKEAEVFSIGYALSTEDAGSELKGITATQILKEVASEDTDNITHYLSSDLSELATVFNNMSNQITLIPAGTDARIISTVGEYFSFKEDLSNKATYDAKTNEVKCEIGKITSEAKSCSFVVAIDYDNVSDNQYGAWYSIGNEKSDDITLNYIDINGKSASLGIETAAEVYAMRSKYNYVINYYKDSISEKNLLGKVEGTEVSGTMISADEDLYLPEGYLLEKGNYSIVLSSENQKLDIVYTKDLNNLKELSYRVEYYQDGKVVNEDIQTYQEEVWIGEDNIIENQNIDISNNRYKGYKLFKTVPENITTEVENGSVIKIYYVKDEKQTKDINYQINTYLEGVYKESLTKTKKVWINDSDSVAVNLNDELKDKYRGYKLFEEKLPTKINLGQVVNVYYVKDEKQTKKISYQINTYLDGKLEDSNEIGVEVWINNADSIQVDLIEKYQNKYRGYKLNIDNIPNEIEDGQKINLYYVKDLGQTKEISYQVDTYINNKLKESNKLSAKVWINDPDTIKVNLEETYADAYLGYKLADKTLPTEVKNSDVVSIYYVKDESQTKEIGYQLNTYLEGVYKESELITKEVWINDSDTININLEEYTNKYTGYKLSEKLPTEVTNNEVININYAKDLSQTKKINYQIDTHLNNVYKETKKVSVQVWVNDPDTININLEEYTNKYVGYKLSEKLPTKVKNNAIVNVYYENDESQTKEISYQVDTYLDNVIKESNIIKSSVWINAENKVKVNLKNTYQNKYLGYKLNIENIPSEVKHKEVVSLYFVKDESQTKQIKYQINTYLEDKLKDSEIITKKVWVNSNEDIEVNLKSLYQDKYVGYKLSEDKIPNKVNDKQVVSLYYVKDLNQTKEVKYQVEYYVDSSLKDSEEIKKNIWINDEDVIKVTGLDKVQDKYRGHKLVNSNYEEIPDTVNDGSVLKFYYEKQTYEYIVEYYYDNVLDPEKTESYTAKYDTLIDKYRDKAYGDYNFSEDDNFPLQIDIENNVIKVYYQTGEPAPELPLPPHTDIMDTILLGFKIIMIALTSSLAIVVLKEERK